MQGWKGRSCHHGERTRPLKRSHIKREPHAAATSVRGPCADIHKISRVLHRVLQMHASCLSWLSISVYSPLLAPARPVAALLMPLPKFYVCYSRGDVMLCYLDRVQSTEVNPKRGRNEEIYGTAGVCSTHLHRSNPSCTVSSASTSSLLVHGKCRRRSPVPPWLSFGWYKIHSTRNDTLSSRRPSSNVKPQPTPLPNQTSPQGD